MDISAKGRCLDIQVAGAVGNNEKINILSGQYPPKVVVYICIQVAKGVREVVKNVYS